MQDSLFVLLKKVLRDFGCIFCVVVKLRNDFGALLGYTLMVPYDERAPKHLKCVEMLHSSALGAYVCVHTCVCVYVLSIHKIIKCDNKWIGGLKMCKEAM